MRQNIPNTLFPISLNLVAFALVIHATFLLPQNTTDHIWLNALLLVLVGMSFVAIKKNMFRFKIGISLAFLATMICFLGIRLTGSTPFGVDIYRSPIYIVILMGFLSLTGFGLFKRAFIGRWAAMALALSGILSAGLNVFPWFFTPSNFTWLFVLSIAGSISLIANLWGETMKTYFVADPSSIWISSDPMWRSLKWAMVSLFATLPMLFVYGLIQPIIAFTGPLALITAMTLIISLVLVTKQKLIGVLGLGISGASLISISALTLYFASQTSTDTLQVAGYYSVFWIPSGLLTMYSALKFSKPIVLLLGKDD